MLAHYHGQLLNLSKIGGSLGVSHPTIRSYIDILTGTYMVRLLPPFAVNLKKRLIKSPKIYIRDTGVLHALLDLENHEDLMGHPTFGASWEGMAIENVLNIFEGWKTGFYRTSAGAELDLVLEKRGRRIGIECKASASPGISKGFRNALQDLKPEKVWIIAPVESAYPIDDRVMVSSLDSFLTSAEKIKQRHWHGQGENGNK
jgi:predicted AAA+ superfamily ATPase